jgi:2-polyprenyl-3-methyl-5-hydroxy-6-metoxy-1,4-benzoquinol methylase
MEPPAKVPTEVLARQVRRLHSIPDGVPFEELREPLRTYVSYAMSTIERGRWALEELVPHGLRPGFRFLDAGCAYGGYLAAAVELGASEVVGVELKAKYLEIAADLLASTGTPARLVQGRLEDGPLLAGLGRFDVITCADVIEHVDDVEAALGNLCRALASGGLLYLAVPNAWCPTCVLRDPHFQLFGITLLPPDEARIYSRAVTGSDYYDVGEFLSLDRYRQIMRRHGVASELVNSPGDLGRGAAELMAEIDRLAAAAEGFADERLPPELVAKVRGGALAVVRDARAAVAATERRSWWPWRGRGDLRAVLDRYAVPTWHLLGRRA